MVRIRKLDPSTAGLPDKLPDPHAGNLDSKKLFVLPDRAPQDLHPPSTDPALMLRGEMCPPSVRVRIFTVLARDMKERL